MKKYVISNLLLMVLLIACAPAGEETHPKPDYASRGIQPVERTLPTYDYETVVYEIAEGEAKLGELLMTRFQDGWRISYALQCADRDDLFFLFEMERETP